MTTNPPQAPDPEGGAQPPADRYPSYPTGPGGMPAYPGDSEPPPSAVPQPQSIVTAVRLMWAGAALSVVELIVALASLGSIKDNIADQLRDNGDFSQDNLDSAYNVAVVSVFVSAIIGIALWLWMARVNGRGRRWARIVASVLGGVNVLFFVVALGQGQATALQLVFSAISVALAVAILVLLWRPESTAFYNARSRRV
jgi:hypothetical protein